MKRISPVASVLAAGAVVLAVSSCAPAVHATSAPTTHPHITAAPHPTQAAIPSVRVPVTCASLFDDTAAGKIIDQPVAIHVDETTPPVDITDITERQYGSLNCVWADGRQDTGYDDSLRIDITPDAAAGFAANLAGFAAENAPTTSNTAGDKSVY